jgi:eukaryotic-like serine/threonine-protein kinase
LTSLLLFTVWLQGVHPYMAQTRALVWICAILLLPLSVIIAIRMPTRPPHDRLIGSYIVPR